MAETADSKQVTKRTWADEDDDGQEEDDVEIGGSAVAQVGKADAPAAEEEKSTEEPSEKPQQPVKKRPTQVRERNKFGDFVVKKINIKEREIPQPVKDEESEEEEDDNPHEGYFNLHLLDEDYLDT